MSGSRLIETVVNFNQTKKLSIRKKMSYLKYYHVSFKSKYDILFIHGTLKELNETQILLFHRK